MADSGKNTYFRFVDIATKPRPKLGAVLDSVQKLYKKKIKERQISMVTQNFVQNDPRTAENPWLAVYENLKPIHAENETAYAVADQSRKVYEPEIINGYSKATGML